MPIEFRCGQCGKLLRTGDETAGRQAQCPECGTLTEVPTPGATPGTPPPLGPLSGQNVGSSGGAAGPSPMPGVAAYGVPAAQRVSGPATALMVTAALGILAHVYGILYALIAVGIGIGATMTVRLWPFPMMVDRRGMAACEVFGLVMAVIVLIGAVKMKNLENYSFAIASAIIAIVPCTSQCCLLGVPFGIWALVVLNDSSVKAAFRS
jgi:phage FluMu protein Com